MFLLHIPLTTQRERSIAWVYAMPADASKTGVSSPWDLHMLRSYGQHERHAYTSGSRVHQLRRCMTNIQTQLQCKYPLKQYLRSARLLMQKLAERNALHKQLYHYGNTGASRNSHLLPLSYLRMSTAHAAARAVRTESLSAKLLMTSSHVCNDSRKASLGIERMRPA